MDKYEFNIKVEQIKKLVGKGDYDTAMKIADTIDWRRVRNTNLLSMVALVYEKNEEYQEAKDILLLAFERAPIGKRLLYKLAELALKEGNVEEAEAYYREFCDLAPEDSRQNLLRYMILKAKGAPAQQLIHSLETYTAEELDEKWMYELAELYHLAGMGNQCVQLCDKIMLMFGLGKYVDKAMELKLQYAPLTSYQMDLVENRDKYEAKLKAVERGVYRTVAPVPEPEEEYQEPPSQASPSRPSSQAYEEDLAARLREVEEEENLAKEMTRLSADQSLASQAAEEPSPMERTRILDDIRNIKPNRGQEEGQEGYLDPMIEEEPLDYPGDEAYDSQGYQEDEPYAIPARPDSGYGRSSYQGPGDGQPPQEGFLGSQAPPKILEEESMADQMPQMEEESMGGQAPQMEEESMAGQMPQMEEESMAGQMPQKAGEAIGGKMPQKVDEAAATASSLQHRPMAQASFQEPGQGFFTPGHMMVQARTPQEGLEMAIDALKRLHAETGANNPVIKITGEKLAKRGVFASAEKLVGKDLIIENAGDMTGEALAQLNQMMEQDQSGMLVVMIDNPRQLEGIRADCPGLAQWFTTIGSDVGRQGDQEVDVEAVGEAVTRQARTQEAIAREMASPAVGAAAGEEGLPPKRKTPARARILAPASEPDASQSALDRPPREEPLPEQEEGEYDSDEEMDIDEFAQYACRYANEIDCSITGKSMLALYERIEIMEEDGIRLNRQNAEDLIEEAADRAEKPSLGKLIKGVFSSKYDKDGLLILKEEHFID